MTETPPLTPDCNACAALCCIALAFDEGDDFAFDKPAGLPCPHLGHHDCTIYEYLDKEGFAGCVRYDCAGAGQRTLALYEGISWRDAPESTAPMLETFRHLRVLHDLVGLLNTAGQLPLEDDETARRDDLLARLCPADMTPAMAETLANGPLPGAVRAFLRDLSHHV